MSSGCRQRRELRKAFLAAAYRRTSEERKQKWRERSASLEDLSGSPSRWPKDPMEARQWKESRKCSHWEI
jgi:hypothetical protein